MLSRNLYEIDEVVSALQTCLRNGWPPLFWAWELYVSEEFSALQKTLKDAWLDYGAPYDIGLLTDLNITDPKQTIEIIYRLQEAIKKVGSLGPLYLTHDAKRFHVTPTTSNPKRIKQRERAKLFTTNEISEEDKDRFWISLDSAARCNWFRDAAWLLQAAQPILSADTIWSAIHLMGRGTQQIKTFLHALEKSSSKSPIDQIRHQAAAIATLCYPTKDHPRLLERPTSTCTRQLDSWALWTANVGRRTARLNPIPVEALHKETTRGSITCKYTNVADVREPTLLLVNGCAWWRRIVQAHGFKDTEDGIEVPDDDDYEDFYDLHFPDDIPDEWSAQDQQKSHGKGVAETAKPQPIPSIREEPVSPREWMWGVHTPNRNVKKT